MSKFRKNLYAAAVLVAGFGVALTSFLLLSPDGRGSGGPDVRPAAEALPVRADSHRLTSPDRSELTVEFKALVEDRLAD